MESHILGYSIRSACDAIPCGRTKIYQLIADGRLEAKKLDGKTIITRGSMVRLAEELPDADIGKAPKDEPAARATT